MTSDDAGTYTCMLLSGAGRAQCCCQVSAGSSSNSSNDGVKVRLGRKGVSYLVIGLRLGYEGRG